MTAPIVIHLSPHEIETMAQRKPDRAKINHTDERIANKLTRACKAHINEEQAVAVQSQMLLAQAGAKPHPLNEFLSGVFGRINA